ncbi:hypothetical protein NPIL_383431, partial [Nephila pilipes]
VGISVPFAANNLKSDGCLLLDVAGIIEQSAPLSTRKCKFIVRSLTNNRNLRQAS